MEHCLEDIEFIIQRILSFKKKHCKIKNSWILELNYYEIKNFQILLMVLKTIDLSNLDQYQIEESNQWGKYDYWMDKKYTKIKKCLNLLFAHYNDTEYKKIDYAL